MQFMVKSQMTMQANAAPPHILVIDDDDAIQVILTMALESEGYEVTSAYSAIDALELLKADASRYDLMILDLYMPLMNGLEFAEKVKTLKLTEQKPIPIMVSSATNRTSEKEAASQFDYFLPKPFDLKVLFEVCEKLLEAKKQ
jgi:CheY-like chemotaxis protein